MDLADRIEQTYQSQARRISSCNSRIAILLRLRTPRVERRAKEETQPLMVSTICPMVQ